MARHSLSHERLVQTNDPRWRTRATVLFDRYRTAVFSSTDRWFAALMGFQWVAGIVAAVVIAPRSWAGSTSTVHPHVWAAVFLGGAISLFPIWLAVVVPGRAVTRYTIAVAQMLTSALLIDLTGGRIETHFHVFGSLAFLAVYRDWTVLIPATVVVAADHLVRGLYWPQSVYGVMSASGWRSIEHAAWAVFEDIFLVASCRRGVREMWQMAERQAQLEAANSAKSDFLATISHEIRTPMNGIFGMTELAYDSSDDAERRDFLLRARACASSLMTVLNDVLDFSKIEAGHCAVEHSPFDLETILDGVLDTLSVEAERRGLVLVGSIALGTPTRIMGDTVRLRQILMNLGTNALKFTEHGEIEVRLEAVATVQGVALRGSVRDTGVGIPREKQAAIFEAFTQAHAGDPRNFGGTGLGLAIVQQLVRLMGGDVRVASAVGIGSTFEFSIPLEPAGGATTGDTLLGGLHILVVDTNATSTRMLEETLRAAGATVTAMSAVATETGAVGPIDAVILAVPGPAIGASVLADALAADTPVIALTSLRPMGGDVIGMRLAATLTKPVKQRALVETVLRVTRATSRRVANVA